MAPTRFPPKDPHPNRSIHAPLLSMKRLSVSCDDGIDKQQMTWHGEKGGENSKSEVDSISSTPWNSKRAGIHFLLPPQDANSKSNLSAQTHSQIQMDEHEKEEMDRHRGILSFAEEYNYKLSRAQLKASSNTSALLVGFAMVALVELHYDENTPPPLLITLGVVTTLLVSVHLLALMMSTCILPYMEATGATQDSPHIPLKFFIKLSWLFSTCIGLILFLIEIGVICYIKFTNIHFPLAAYITTAMMIPVFIIFVVISYLIHRNRTTHSIERIKYKVAGLTTFLAEERGLMHMVKNM